MTRINPEDPKWTAYVLGELDDSERAAIELELETSEEARLLVEELRFAAQLTSAELREAVPIVPLSEQQRETIRKSAAVLRPRLWFKAPAVWATGLAVAGAAVIVLAVALAPLQRRAPIQTNALPPSTEALHSVQAMPAPETATAKTAKPAPDFELRYQHSTIPTAALQAAESAAASRAIRPQQQVVVSDGHVFGIVRDSSGAVIPGVTITATNLQTGTAVTAATDGAGAYAFANLQPGTYKITGELPGFRTGVYEGIQLAANLQAKQDITLQIASAAQSVEVSRATALSASSASVVDGRQGVVAGIAGIQRLQGQQAQQGQQGQQAQLRFGQAYMEAAPPPPPLSSRLSSIAPGVPRRLDTPFGRVNGAEAYNGVTDNPFLSVAQNPLSTFSIDVDTASYSNVRRFLNQSQLPPRDAVRIEEMINYFSYDYPQPAGNNPIGAAIEAASAPWNPQHRLVRVAIKAKDIDAKRRPASNLVFLLDVSGSMQPAERLPLLKDGLRMLVEQLTANDRVTVVTYAGTTGVALRPTRGDQKDVILNLIDSLQAGGSTNGGSGIQLAYEQAAANFITGGVNRVILATDGDFKVGITDHDALLRLIEEKAKSGVFLSVLGVGMGNYKDATLEMLADKGHGNYAYIDTLNEAHKVLVEQMSGTLITVAKDVKVQVEFNPAVVNAYRLIGYENRALRNEDFNNDLKDGGDMGAGHTVTVLYEVVPHGVSINGVDPLKYQQAPPAAASNASNETMNVKIRYKEPAASDSKLLVFPLVDREQTFARSSLDFRFAAAVASFGMILRDSPYKGTSSLDSVMSIAEDSLGSDRNGYRREFLQLIQRARQIRGR